MRKFTLKNSYEVEQFMKEVRACDDNECFNWPGTNTVVFTGEPPEWCDCNDEWVSGYDQLMMRIG